MPRLPLKKTEKIAEKQAYGETLGKLKAHTHFEQTKKGFLKTIRQYINKLIGNINPLELAAVIATTVLIKQTIDRVEELKNAMKEFRTYTQKGGVVIPPPLIGGIGLLRTIGVVTEQITQRMGGETFEWLISFAIAYIIVKHGGQLIGLLGNSLTQIIKLFLVPTSAIPTP